MSEQKDMRINNDYVFLGKKSLYIVFKQGLITFFLIPIVCLIGIRSSHVFYPLALCAFLYGLFSFFETLSLKIFYDKNGVWIAHGFLPWKKGIFGIKWRDLEVAYFYPNMKSWIFNSYKISVKNRFSSEIEFLLNDIGNGKNIVIEINSVHETIINQQS